MDPHLLLPLVLDRKPHVSLVVELVDKLEERAPLEELVADLVLDVGDHFEEFGVVDLRVAHDVAERVGERGLKLQQRLEGHLVDVLEAIAVEVGEVLGLKFANEFLVGVLQEHLPYGSTRVYVEYLLMQFLLDQPLGLILVDYALLDETVYDQRFLLSLGDLDVEERVDFVDVVVH